MAVSISICIPAYKRTNYLRRLLDSIIIQTFKDVEVVVTDDSPDESVLHLCAEYKDRLPIRYFKNNPALGTPANWNYGISKASGEWIKLMHDDDWFATAGALTAFYKHTKNNSAFIFSAYNNLYENGSTKTVRLSSFWQRQITKQPAALMANNVIGPPSVTMVHRSIKEQYDERLKWRVDIEFYYRVLQHSGSFIYINEPLVNIGISETQVTQSCINKPEVELPEGLLLLQKQGESTLRNIVVYDAWWRLLRNMNIKDEMTLKKYADEVWPVAIVTIATDLSSFPALLLRVGTISKALMFLSYVKSSFLK